MMRKIGTRLRLLLLAAMMLLLLAGCGAAENPADGQEQEEQTAQNQQQTPEIEQTPAITDPEDSDLTEEPLDEVPAPDTSAEDDAQTLPTDPAVQPEGGNLPADPNEKPQGQQVQKPVEQQPPVQQPAETPAESGVDLTAFYDSLAASGSWPAMTALEGEVLDAFYAGLSEVSTQQCSVYTAMISAVVGEIALVEVTDEADVQTVKDIFQARIDYQVGEDGNPGAAMYPATIEGWSSNSRIVSHGNYVMLVVCEGADDVVTAFNALFA